MARRLWIVFLLALFAFSFLPVYAGDNQGATFTMDCNGFTGTAGSIKLTNDNTNKHREAFIVSATDGAGNVIYEPVEDSFFVGGTVSWEGGPQVKWTKPPQYNPLVLRVVSRAGNNFGESLVLMAVGECANLPTFGILPAGVYVVDGDTLVLGENLISVPAGTTSPTVALNNTPPRPKNDPANLQGLPAFFIVNTDNLSLRSGDGPKYTLVGIVDGGTKLIPLGRNDDFSWWYVQAGNIVGWAKAEFLILRGDATGVPVVPSLGEIIEPRVFIHVVQTLFSAPETGALPLCSIDNKQEYYVVGRNGDTSWYQIQATCDGALVKGWIPAGMATIRNPAEQRIPVTN